MGVSRAINWRGSPSAGREGSPGPAFGAREDARYVATYARRLTNQKPVEKKGKVGDNLA